MIPRSWPPGSLLALVLLAFVLRVAWPLADPAAGLSWSNGIYTDPAAISHAARNAVLFGEWVRDSSRDLAFYPLLNGITWAAYRLFGVSRLTAQGLAAILGTLAVLAAAAAVARGRGRSAGLLVTLLAGTSFWLAMFSRIPVAENLTAALLAAACVAAMARGVRAGLVAGALAGVAALFGKIHAIAFAPALLAFLALRERRPSATVPPLAGLGLVAVAWVVAILVPFRTAILDQVNRADELYGALPVVRGAGAAVAAVLETLRSAWIFHRMPVLGTLGGLFIAGTLLDRELLRRRLDDGTALFVLWFVASWAMLVALPYRAPRYYVPAVLPLVVVGACQLHDMATGARSWPGRLAVAVWIAVSAVVAVDVAVHGLFRLEDRLVASLDPGTIALRERVTAMAEWLRPARTHLGVAAAMALAIGAGMAGVAGLRRRRARAGAPTAAPPNVRIAFALGAVVVALQALQFAGWMRHRTYAIEEAKGSLDAIVAEDAVLLGAFAPLLVQDGRRVGVPLYGNAEPGLLAASGATHVVFGGARDRDALERVEPGILARSDFVRAWPMRTHRLRSLQLFRVPHAAYEPTAFERGMDRLSAGQPEAALRELAAQAPAGPPVPDFDAMEARCLYALGDAEGARAALERALAIRPTSSADWFNLGRVRDSLGDRAGARRAWLRCLELDPWDADALEALRERRD